MKTRTRKKSLNKTIFRDIKGSFGRFFAIFAIIALGVGFFSGVKITTPILINTIDNLYKEKSLYDYKLVSTLGWEDKDVENVKKRKDVEYAEGAFQYDVQCLDNEGKDLVFKAYSLTDNVNGLMLREGRLPENSSEVLIDNTNRSGFSIGDTMRLSPSNDEEIFDHFTNTEYTVVGFADSVLYINFERGSTSLGNGVVNGFIYLTKDGFAEDVYTEIYVKLHDDSLLYSDEYKNEMDDIRPEWEDAADSAAEGRYDRIYSEAAEEIADARETLSEEKADAEKELADAKKELDDGKAELEDAASEIEDGEQELADASSKLSSAKRTLDSSKSQLNTARTTLDDSKEQLDSSKSTLDSSARELSSAKETLDASLTQLTESKAVLDASKIELDKNEALLNSTRQELDSAKAELDADRIYKTPEEILDKVLAFNDSHNDLRARIRFTGEGFTIDVSNLNADNYSTNRSLRRRNVEFNSVVGWLDSQTIGGRKAFNTDFSDLTKLTLANTLQAYGFKKAVYGLIKSAKGTDFQLNDRILPLVMDLFAGHPLMQRVKDHYGDQTSIILAYASGAIAGLPEDIEYDSYWRGEVTNLMINIKRTLSKMKEKDLMTAVEHDLVDFSDDSTYYGVDSDEIETTLNEL